MKWFQLFFLLMLCTTICAQNNISDHYKIYDVRAKQLTTIDKIVNNLAEADVLFFGEEHNDSAGHYLENELLKALFNRYNGQLVLSLEMFEKDGQLGLNEYLNGFIDETRFSKDVRLWSNYKDYRPMIEFAKTNRIPVIAANTPRRYVSLVTKRGMKALDSLSKEAKMFLPPLPYDTLSGRYREKFMDIMQGSPGGNSGNIYYSQSLWDAGMSYSIYSYLKKNKAKKIFHCVGKFHCDEKLGTLAQLQMRDKKLRILNISCFSDESFDNPVWDRFTNLGDYLIMTDPQLKKTF